MGAPLRCVALFQYQNLVGILNGGKAVGDHQDGFPFGQALKCHLNFVFVLGISEGGRLVQQNDGGILEDGPCKSDALLFSTGEIDALGPQHGVHALWQFL